MSGSSVVILMNGMLQLSSMFMDRQIVSLRNGALVGTAIEPVINPNNLKLEGWYAQNTAGDDLILPVIELRDIIKDGFVVNDYDALTDREDLVRMKQFIDLHFLVIGKVVQTENGTKLGKVNDYAINAKNFYVQKLYVSPRLLQTFSQNQLTIDRTMITEITDRKIIVKDSTANVRRGKPAMAQA
jgi:sporulation protein YlmC with PRC-barrel domain